MGMPVTRLPSHAIVLVYLRIANGGRIAGDETRSSSFSTFPMKSLLSDRFWNCYLLRSVMMIRREWTPRAD